MDKNSVYCKVLDYFWVLLVFIPIFNGLGFIYAGWRVGESRWVDEGIIYMIPYILFSFTIYHELLVYVVFLFYVVGIIRFFMIIRVFREKVDAKSMPNVQQDTQYNIQNDNILNERKDSSSVITENKEEILDDKGSLNDKKSVGRRIDL